MMATDGWSADGFGQCAFRGARLLVLGRTSSVSRLRR